MLDLPVQGLLGTLSATHALVAGRQPRGEVRRHIPGRRGAAGNRAEARSRLSSPHLAVPDPAWYALADQLEHCRGGLRWDGVFRFCDK